MKASAMEYRLRYPIHVAIYLLGFWSPWEHFGAFSFGKTTVWTTLAVLLARGHWLSFAAASRMLLLLAIVAALVAAALRIWGSAYLGARVVHAGTLEGNHLVTGGPYRFSRNPLYLGTMANALALCLLMPVSGAVATMLLLGVEQWRLVGAEEAFLQARFATAYGAYLASVPRLWPTLRTRIPPTEERPDWIRGLLSEVFFAGSAVSFLLLGSTYNGSVLQKGILIAFGLALIARAFL